jgi:hypothetical protein
LKKGGILETKEKIDLNKTLVDIIHKKILILLGAVAEELGFTVWNLRKVRI